MIRLAGNESEVEAKLMSAVPAVKRLGPGRWEFLLNSEHDLPGSMSLDDDWIAFEILTPPQKAALTSDPWQIALANANLVGVSRLSFSAEDQSLILRADIPMTRKLAPDSLVKAFDDLTLALDRLSGSKSPGTKIIERPNYLPPDVRQTCEEHGWNITERQDRTLLIDLASGDAFHQARVGFSDSGGITLAADVIRMDEPSKVSKAAIGSLLGRVSAVIRMVRPCVARSDERYVVRLEAALPRMPAEHDIHEGLSALSVACRMCGRELEILRDEHFAGEYLAMTGWGF